MTEPQHLITANDETERALLQRYLDRKQGDLEKLEQAIADADFDLARRIGHNLAGSGAAYGFFRVTDLGGRIEAAAARSATDELRTLLADLRAYLAAVIIG